jgi:hypothetical protein
MYEVRRMMHEVFIVLIVLKRHASLMCGHLQPNRKYKRAIREEHEHYVVCVYCQLDHK